METNHVRVVVMDVGINFKRWENYHMNKLMGLACVQLDGGAGTENQSIGLGTI